MTELKELNVFDKILEPVFPLINQVHNQIVKARSKLADGVVVPARMNPVGEQRQWL